MTPDDLLQAYKRAAVAYGVSSDPEASNSAHDELIKIVLALRDSGQERRILELLDDDSEHIRLRAGFDALALSPADGMRVLRALADGPHGSVRADAAMILRLRENGELVLYPWDL